MRAVVIGHLEWVEFIRVGHVPARGEIVHAEEWWEEPGGGGSVAAVQLGKLGADTAFFTALGDDELGHRAFDELSDRGVRVHAAFRSEATRRAVTHIDAAGERTITVLGPRLAPHGSDDLPWAELEDADCVYFTAGDRAALRSARAAPVLVATSRAQPVVTETGVPLDALVGSSFDPGEGFSPNDLSPVPRLCIWTESDRGGRFSIGDGAEQRYEASSLHGPIVDRYGAGDSFAAGLTFALGAGEEIDKAISLAARCGAATLGGRGPYEGQLQFRS